MYHLDNIVGKIGLSKKIEEKRVSLQYYILSFLNYKLLCSQYHHKGAELAVKRQEHKEFMKTQAKVARLLTWVEFKREMRSVDDVEEKRLKSRREIEAKKSVVNTESKASNFFDAGHWS